MKFPTAQFNLLKKQFPNHSSLILFGRLISGRGIPDFYIKKWMRNIDKSDYEESDFEDLAIHFKKLNHAPKIALFLATSKSETLAV
jgi:hypothetical protein